MKSITYQWLIYDEETRLNTKHPWYLAKGWFGGRLVSGRVLHLMEGVPSYFGIAYWEYRMDACIMYPRPLHLVVRYVKKLNYWYWGFLRLCYWVGVIDDEEGVMFRWSDFWRVRQKR